MKEVRQAIVLVDTHRRLSRMRNTAGRYRVGAKTEKEAVALVRKAVGFGSVQFYFWDKKNVCGTVPYKSVVKEVFDGGGKWKFESPLHALASRWQEKA